MDYTKPVALLSFLILILSLAACLWALAPGEGEGYVVTSAWDEDVLMHGRGLYHRDSRSYAVQAIAQDWVTLVLGIPLMAVSLVLSGKGSYRGKLMRTGVLGYFLYTYASYSFLMTYNKAFLLYVALFSLSLFGFIFSFADLDVASITDHAGLRFPRKRVAGFFLFVGLMLLMMWLGRIIPSLSSDAPPYGLETYTTLVIQALDLGIIVPVSLFAAIALLQRRPLGFALASIVAIKGITLFSAISAMALLMKLNGVDINLIELIIFPAATLINFRICYLILRNMK